MTYDHEITIGKVQAPKTVACHAEYSTEIYRFIMRESCVFVGSFASTRHLLPPRYHTNRNKNSSKHKNKYILNTLL